MLILLKVLGVIAGELIVSWLLVFCPLWEHRKGLMSVDTADQFLGVVLAAAPDLENQARRAGFALLENVRHTRSTVRRWTLWLRRTIRQTAERAANIVRRRLGKATPRTFHLGGVVSPTGSVTLTVMRGGTVEERLSRLENEMARLQGQWRADMSSLKDLRVEFRWYGISLILNGLIMLGMASW